MGKLLGGVIVWALGSFVAKLFAALGISIATYAALTTLVETMLSKIEPMLSQLPATVLSLMSLAGVGQGLTILASAVATRSAFLAAQTFVTVMK